MPGIAEQRVGVRRRGRRRGRARRRRRRARGTGRPAPGRARAASAGPRGRASARRRRVGKRWVSPSRGSGERARRTARTSRAGDGAGGGDADLLAEHGADRELVAVDVAGHPQPGRRAHQRPEHRVAGERVADGDRVAVGVEQPAYALDGGGDVAQVVERERRRHERGRARPRLVGQLEPNVPVPCGQPEGAGVRRAGRASRPRDRAGARKSSSARPGERRAHGEPQLDRAAASSRARAGRAARSARRRRPRGPCR